MIDSLTSRIFAIFWLTLALVLMLVLMLPKLDSRQMTALLENEYRQGVMLEQHIEADLAADPPNDLFWWRRLFRVIEKWSPPGQRLVFVTSEGRIFGTLQKTECRLCVTLSASPIMPTIRRRKIMVDSSYSGHFPCATGRIITRFI